MKSEQVLSEKRMFVLDMDGTFYLGDRIIEGALDFIQKVRESGKDFIFFTNNSSKTSDFYKSRLASMGCFVDSSKIATSGDVATNYLNRSYGQKRVYFVGTGIVERDLREMGINIVSDSPDVVLVAFDTELTYEKLSKACAFIRSGSAFIATHPDLNCPTETGFIPDCGAICEMISAATGVRPKYLGKPYRETVDFILDRTGLALEDIVFAGDRLYTDIAVGYNHGAASLLVLTGETKIEDVKASKVKPDFIYPSLGAVAEDL